MILFLILQSSVFLTHTFIDLIIWLCLNKVSRNNVMQTIVVLALTAKLTSWPISEKNVCACLKKVVIVDIFLVVNKSHNQIEQWLGPI